MKRLVVIFAATLLAVSAPAQGAKVLFGAQAIKTLINPPNIPHPKPVPPGPGLSPWTGVTVGPIGPKPIPPVPNISNHLEELIQKAEEYRKTIKGSTLSKQIKKERALILIRECQNGRYDKDPNILLAGACEAEKYNVGDKGVSIAKRAMQSKNLSSVNLLDYTPKSKELTEQWQMMSRSLVENAFLDRLSKGDIFYPAENGINNADWDSLCLKNRVMSEKYSPTHNPLLNIVESIDYEAEIPSFIEATDSVIVHPYLFGQETKKNLFTNLLKGLMYEERYSDALDYFSREPLKTFADTTLEITLNLFACAFSNLDQDKVNAYTNRAFELDSGITENYLQNVYDDLRQNFLEKPDVELGKWLIENSAVPAAETFNLYVDIIKKLNFQDQDWEWLPDSVFTEDAKYLSNVLLELCNFAITIDEGKSPSYILPWLKFFSIDFSTNDNSDLKLVENEYLAQRNQLEGDLSPEICSLRAQLIISQAFVAGHGLDKPKEALKILKKNIDFLKTPGIYPEIKESYYDYMSALYSKLGKKKDAAKYQALSSEMKKEAEMLDGITDLKTENGSL